MAQPAPFGRAVVDAVDRAIRAQRPHHGMSALPRAWLVGCVPAVLATNAIGGARWARASWGTYALAALSRRLRHRKMPWDARLAARVRVSLRHDGLTGGRLVIDASGPRPPPRPRL